MKEAIKRTREELEYAILNLELEIKMLKGGRIHLDGNELTQVDQTINKMTQDLSMVKKKYELLRAY